MKRVRNNITPSYTSCSMTPDVSFSNFRSDAKCHGSVTSMKLAISHSDKNGKTCLLLVHGEVNMIDEKYQSLGVL